MKRNRFEKKDGAVNRTKDTFEKYNFKNTFVNKYLIHVLGKSSE